MAGGIGASERDLALLGTHVADRLRHLPPARLEPLADQVPPALAELARLALRAEGEPARALVPVGPTGWGDVVEVLVTDLVAAVDQGAGADVEAAARTVLLGLRRVLP